MSDPWFASLQDAWRCVHIHIPFFFASPLVLQLIKEEKHRRCVSLQSMIASPSKTHIIYLRFKRRFTAFSKGFAQTVCPATTVVFRNEALEACGWLHPSRHWSTKYRVQWVEETGEGTFSNHWNPHNWRIAEISWEVLKKCVLIFFLGGISITWYVCAIWYEYSYCVVVYIYIHYTYVNIWHSDIMDIFVIDDMYFWLFIYCIDYSLSPMKLAWTHTLMYLVFTCSFGWSVVSVWARLIEHCVVNVHIAVAWSDGWVGFASDLILGVPLFYNCDDTLRDDVFPRGFFKVATQKLLIDRQIWWPFDH